MSFNIGKKPSLKEELEGYVYIKTSDVPAICDKVLIERVKIAEGVNLENGSVEAYGAIAGSAVKEGQFVKKIWFYIPNVDNADLIKSASPEDCNLIEGGNYIYIIEIKESKNGRKYCIGTLEKD